MYQTTTLPNGLTIATAEMPQMTSVSLGLWVGIGSRYEPARLNGVCHFIEHLLFKGTKRRSAREISQAVEGVGGYLNAFTSEETTCFHAKACHDRFDEVFDVLADMLLNSKFAPADITKEREVIKEEIAMYRDDPQQHVQELLNATLWPNQPLGRAITGTAATLGRMSRRHLTGYLRENYVTQATVLVAAGRVKHRHAMRAGARLARRLQAGRRATFAPVLVGRTGPRVKLFTRKIEQTHLALGFRACSRHDPRHHALRLLNTILGENMSSRLFQIVREDRGLAYSIYSTPSFFADAGDLVVSAGLDAENLPKTLPLILRELRRCAKTAPSPAELRRARDYVRGQIDLGSESTDYQMNWLGEQWLGYGHIQSPEETKRRLSSVTPSQIRAIAESVFRPENLHMAMVSPWKDEKAVLAMLKF